MIPTVAALVAGDIQAGGYLFGLTEVDVSCTPYAAFAARLPLLKMFFY